MTFSVLPASHLATVTLPLALCILGTEVPSTDSMVPIQPSEHQPVQTVDSGVGGGWDSVGRTKVKAFLWALQSSRSFDKIAGTGACHTVSAQ